MYGTRKLKLACTGIRGGLIQDENLDSNEILTNTGVEVKRATVAGSTSTSIGSCCNLTVAGLREFSLLIRSS